ncbi:MAG: hypothetical protein ACXVHX_24225, partial [Solirubrobacteraceae bacterium]
MAESGERTAAEREAAARLERERRRQERLVEPGSPASDGDGDRVGADPAWDDGAVRTESRPEHADLDGYESLPQGAELAGDSDMDDDDD